METLTTYHQRSRITYLAKLITAGDAEPGTAVTLDSQTLAEIDHGKKIICKPRLNWYQVTIQDMWTEIRKDHPDANIRYASNLDINKAPHVAAVKTFA